MDLRNFDEVENEMQMTSHCDFFKPGSFWIGMYMCVCKGVSEKQIEELLLKGKRNLEEISNACGAGTDCGSCRRRLERKIENTPAHSPHEAIVQQSKKD